MALISEILNVFIENTKNIYNYTVFQLKHPSFTNVYYCVLIAYLFCFTLEVVLPKQRKHGLLSRKGFWLDTFYVFFNDVIVYVIGLFGLCAVTELIFLKILGLFGVHTLKFADITHWNPILQVGILFVIQDFCEFWAHYFLHRFDILWAFHKIHHAQETLGAGSTRRFHFVEMFIFKPIIYITGNLANKNNCEYHVVNVSFTTEDILVLTMKSDPRNACYLDDLKQINIDLSKVDFKRTNSVETTQRVLLYPEKMQSPFELMYGAKSQMNHIKYLPFNVIIAFDKGATYEPNLATRLARALLKLNQLIPKANSGKELY